MRFYSLCAALLLSTTAFGGPLEDLQGKWTTGLMTDEEGYVQFRQIYEFDGSDCTVRIDLFVNHPFGQAGERMKWECGFRILGPSAAVEGAYEIDIDIRRHVLTPLHPTSVEDYNDRRLCGLTGWELGVPRDVTNLNCRDHVTMAGTMKDLIKIVPNETIQFGIADEDDPMSQVRPTELDPDNIVPRNGQGGPIDPHPEPDLIKGFYQVTDFKQNASGCDETGLRTQAMPFSHFQLIANRDIIPMMVGWSFETCASEAACRSEPDRLRIGDDFFITDEAGRGKYRGDGRASLWTGKCEVNAVQTVTGRAADGSLHLVSKFLSGVVDGIDTAADCDLDNPLIDAQIPLLQCNRMLEMKGRRL